MCAINGFNFKDEELVRKMNKATSHRGPDGTGIFCDDEISLGHNRLSIIDLSDAASQPMMSFDGRQVIVFNGEIYNFKELKNELGDYPFKTNSDTEVILAAYQRWGKDCVKRFNGIFAFAIWDKVKKELFIARDNIGVKPLYYYFENRKFIFSSEIKAILKHNVPRVIDLNSFNIYLRTLYVPSPLTMFKDIKKISPGSYLILSKNGLKSNHFWDSKGDLPQKRSQKEVREAVFKSVKSQLISDRPLGVYLSGGIDSSVILDSVKKFTDNIDTFSVGFDLDDNEEREKFNADFNLARKTSEFYSTRHHEVLVSAKDVWRNLERAIWHLDEPVSNPTIIPMISLSRFAKEKVAVVLSGDGGDEIFGGYERYQLSLLQDYYQKIPKIFRKLLKLFPKLKKLGVEKYIDRLALFMFQKDDLLKEVVRSDYFNRYPYEFFEENYLNKINGQNFSDLLMKIDRKTWLVDEDLLRADKMGMANGLEVRVPLLDKNLVEFSENIPFSQKINLSNAKIILKQAFSGRIPDYLLKQPKRGWFSPGAKWLRRPEVLSKAREVLLPNYYKPTKEMFDWRKIEEILENHISGKKYNLTIIWTILTFQIWAKKYRMIIPNVQ